MAFQLTNGQLNQLASSLGFEPGAAAANNVRWWRHPQSGCELLLPVNKVQQAPRPADLVGMRAQLDQQGHLSEEAFDLFVAEGRLPTGAPQSN